jgi:hypothetical protein
MYTLRIIEETRENEKAPFGQVIENFGLGNSYSILKKGITKEFDETMKKNHPETNHNDIKALLCAENGLEFFIYTETTNINYTYFIMTENGKTFERL